MGNTEYWAHRYAKGEITIEEFVAWLHWYCPPNYYPYPYKGDAVEHWHVGAR